MIQRFILSKRFSFFFIVWLCSSVLNNAWSFVSGNEVNGDETDERALIFKETFDQFAGTGGNDGIFGGRLQYTNLAFDNDGWETHDIVGASCQCVELGSSSSPGTITTPEIGYNGRVILKFRAASWTNKSSVLNLSVSKGTLETKTVQLENEKFNEYSVVISNCTANTKITFTAKKDKQVFLDDIMIYGSETVSVTSWGVGTFVPKNNVDFTNSGVDAYVVTGITSPFTLQQVYVVEAGTPVIVSASQECTCRLFPTQQNADVVTFNLLQKGEGKVVNCNDFLGYNCYVLAVVNGDAGFYPAANNNVPNDKAYLKVPEGDGAQAKSFMFDFTNHEVTTDVQSVMQQNNNDVIRAYDLLGRPCRGSGNERLKVVLYDKQPSRGVIDLSTDAHHLRK